MAVLSLQTNVVALSVEEAYRAIPHRRTVFQSSEAKMFTVEKKCLDKFFHLVDLVIVERVEMLSWLELNVQKCRERVTYDKILNDLKRLDVPSSLSDVHRLVIESIELQRNLLEEWQNYPERKIVNLTSDHKVCSVNQKLILAYQKLVSLFSNESPHNKQAFFDYLSALSFI
jgi:hypothetical protein